MDARRVTRVLRADAVVSLVAALVFLSASWQGLYDELDLPLVKGPPIFIQLGGALLLGFAYLLWVAPGDARLTKHVSAAAAFANAAGAGIIVVWLLAKSKQELGLGDRGTAILIAAAVVLAAFAVLEARIARRPLAVEQVDPAG